MSKHFAHLHLHTEYSLLDGAIRIPDLVAFAQQQRWSAVGISDHGNIFGAVKFFQTAQKAGIKPILGCEMYFSPDVARKDVKEKYYHLILIVQNAKGYENLCRLMAFAYKKGFYFKPRIDYQILKAHAEGLVATTGCLGGHIPSLLSAGNEQEALQRGTWFLDVFRPDRFFVEIQPPDFDKQKASNERLIPFAQKIGAQLVATSDSHYLKEEDHEAHEVLLAVQTRKLFSDPTRFSFGEFKGHLRTTEDMLKQFEGHEEAVWNSGKIADSCDFNFEFGKLFFPRFDVPKEHNEESYFRALCTDGLEKLKNSELVPRGQYAEYHSRLKLEMDLIVSMGFVGYFLVVGDFISWAKEKSVAVGPGRGSVAGSLVAWALGITGVDPIKYNLLFERFLNPERVSMPDIDIDFCIERREEVINYVREKYGSECVCQIITFGTMMAKGVIKDVARTLGFPFKDATAITDLVPDQLKITISEAIDQEPRLKDMIESNPEVKKLIDVCLKLEGLTRHASKHAAGVVIAPKPLEQMLPLYVPSKTTELVAQYAMTELESVGFLKMDFLGLKNLTLIERTLTAIKKNHGVSIDLEKVDFSDTKTFELLCRGETNGVFQFESDGIKDVLRKLRPDKFEDLIAVNALYRPGPLGSGMVDDFIDRRHGRKKTTYTFDELEPILGETYGVIVYQEQVMKIASTIAGYSLGSADILRRAMGKKKVEVMAEQKELFLKGAQEKGFDGKKADDLFELMAYFAGYGFNKSHSTAYALIAYHTAYLKANYPLEFMAALVSFETNNPDKLTHYLQEINDMSLTTMPPSINNSDIEFTAQDGKIIFGLQGIKNVGRAALENILEKRSEGPFEDLLDFCMRVDLRSVNKRVIESFIGTGAMDELPGNRAQQMDELEKVIALAVERKEALRTGQMTLFAPGGESAQADRQRYTFQPRQEWSDREKLEREKELAGFYLSSHPLKTYQPILKHFSFDSFSDALAKVALANPSSDILVTTCGLMQTHKVIQTKKGDRMAFATLEDVTGAAEIIIFPRLFKKVEGHLEDGLVFIVRGKLDLASANKCKILADSIQLLENVFEKQDALSLITLTLPEQVSSATCQELKEQLGNGKIPVEMNFFENGEQLLLHPSLKARVSMQSLKALERMGVHVRCTLE